SLRMGPVRRATSRQPMAVTHATDHLHRTTPEQGETMVRNAHRSRRRVFTALATATAITLAIGACGGDDDDAGAPADAPDPTSAPAATDPPTSEPDSDEPDTDEPATSEPTSPDAGAGSAELDELIAAAQAEEKIVFYGVANEET